MLLQYVFILLMASSLYPSVVLARAETYFERSGHYLAVGQVVEARRALQAELRVRPENIEARYNLALLLQQMNHHNQALALYKENLSMVWHLPSVINLVNILDLQNKSTEARQWLHKATQNLHYEASPWYLLGQRAEHQAQLDKAMFYYKKAIKIDAINGFAWLYLASFEGRQHHSKAAFKHAAKALRLLPNCAPCWRIYGEILATNAAHELALEAYQHSLAIQTSDQTRQQLIISLRSLGEHKRADRMQLLVK